MTTLADLRAKMPDLDGLDDRNAIQYLQEAYYPEMPVEQIAQRLGYQAPPVPTPSPGKLRTAADMGLKAAQGVVDVGQSVVGLASLATGGLAGQGMRAIGYDPKATNEIIGQYLSPAQQEAEQNVQKATGFVDTLIALARNPRAIAGGVAESAPGLVGMGAVQMAAAKAIALKAAAPLGGLATDAGAAAARTAVEDAAGRLMTYGSLTEGAQTAGQIADQAQGEGRTYGQYAGPALAAGAGTAAIGRLAGKLMGDAETKIFTGAGGVKGSLPTRTAKSLFSEGFLEEMPQSAQEQVWTNISQGKPWDEGVANAAAQGLVLGGAMGAGMGAIQSHTHPLERAQAHADAAFQAIGTAPTVDAAIQAAMASTPPLVAPRETAMQTAEREAKNKKTMDSVRAEHPDNDLAKRLAVQPEDDIPAGIVPGSFATATPQTAPSEQAPAPNPLAVAAAAQQLEKGAKPAESGPEQPLFGPVGPVLAPQTPAEETDPLLEEARAAGPFASPQRIQNRFRIGYNRAAKLFEQLKTPAQPVASNVLDAAAHQAAPSPRNDLAEPTDGQKEAGNYAKGHTRIAGLDISIENPQGSTRSGKSPDGTTWSNTLNDHYGYIRRTTGNDSEQVDTFIKPGTPTDYAGPVFVVDQYKDNGEGPFDEHKVMLGYSTADEAQAAYQSNYHDTWDGGKHVTSMSMDAFKEWVNDGEKRQAAIADLGSVDSESTAQRPELTLEAQTPEALSQKAEREAAALAAEAEARAPAPPAPPGPADFQLTGSDRPADRPGQGDLLSGASNGNQESTPVTTSGGSREGGAAARGIETNIRPAARQDAPAAPGQGKEPVRVQVGRHAKFPFRAQLTPEELARTMTSKAAADAWDTARPSMRRIYAARTALSEAQQRDVVGLPFDSLTKDLKPAIKEALEEDLLPMPSELVRRVAPAPPAPAPPADAEQSAAWSKMTPDERRQLLLDGGAALSEGDRTSATHTAWEKLGQPLRERLAKAMEGPARPIEMIELRRRRSVLKSLLECVS